MARHASFEGSWTLLFILCLQIRNALFFLFELARQNSALSCSIVTGIVLELQMFTRGAGIAQLVVLGLAVHSVTGSILLRGHFPVEGIFPLELTWVQTPFPQKLLRMRV